ncbi:MULTISPECIES: bifunctional ADP-dependent NAD(P)H-hydrate dehydratase/NAD(P)H-hydrate epimerase [unclassified Paenibacillus]|uniref:bifunctional ADP-dependent NAD(P)H-hydrate dehydratase/NAD(P)H-hydrate epimerase n=1 Tax=unclassified Paenibacillus TaxID=185978 RepID=UPI0009551676|nr:MULTISPECIES: bifunctional ADP-dependent NAD(P)H-hydrate dehydratase/NAD(P)H-hydrate epimerase [unclassified Paenibacillus]ASS66786.1 bifunctional ADP-dependent NAD(P)H-hydrate dehydratase/NAD(P)H-hydrate epimerase [Paenibacillus sp. RUD330]SIP95484.1 NAD(P)H-hydrate epimerase [Paenibacillus sp. RU4X]SIQ13995.1 NAD(P)H-hydrate epimerase [Paenibacillus sp. RU4T]
MNLATAQQMRRLEEKAMEGGHLTAAALMENAGRALAEAVCRFVLGHDLEGPYARLLPGSPDIGGGSSRRPGDHTMSRRLSGEAQPWAVLTGKGRNGGDGLAAARHLALLGLPVRIVYSAPPEQLDEEAVRQRRLLHKLPAALQPDERVYEPGAIEWNGFGGIVDALLGTGTVSGPLREPVASLIREANGSGLPIVSADLPSGVEPDTGAVSDPCIQASATVAFGLAKIGLAQYPGAGMAGSVLVAPIGAALDPAALDLPSVHMLSEPVLRNVLGEEPDDRREGDSNKGTYGHVLTAAGSRLMSGAGLLCAAAALRAGAGLVTWALPDRMAEAVIGLRPELMLASLEDGGSGGWQDVDPDALASAAAEMDSLVIGPGLGKLPSGWLRRLWQALPESLPIVLDADALNHLAAEKDFASWPRRQGGAVLTPHPGEMARLTGWSTQEVQRSRIEAAGRYAFEHGVTLVLKGVRTVIAAPDGTCFVNPTGNAGMATGGTGDVLAGIIGSLLAQGKSPAAAAALGVWRHGAAGDRAAAARRSPASLIAGDLIEHL